MYASVLAKTGRRGVEALRPQAESGVQRFRFQSVRSDGFEATQSLNRLQNRSFVKHRQRGRRVESSSRCVPTFERGLMLERRVEGIVRGKVEGKYTHRQAPRMGF